MNVTPDIDYLRAVRGMELRPGIYRQFCSKCWSRLEVTDPMCRHKNDLVCDECRPPIQSCNELSMAFSPTSKERT